MKTPQTVFDIVRQYNLDCDLVQKGWVQAAASKRIWESQQRVAEDYNRYGDATSVIDGNTLTEKTGAYGHAGGLFCPVAGSIHLWGGRLGMTKSGLPFMHEIAPGLIAGMAFIGQGIGMGTMMGRELASYTLNGDRHATGFPVTAPDKFALHAFNGIGVSMSIKWFALMDYLDSVR